MIWQYETGSLGYGNGLKSFIVRDKKLYLEEFGECETKESKTDQSNLVCGKFSAKNVIRRSYMFDGETFILKSEKIIETPITKVWNYSPEISINN